MGRFHDPDATYKMWILYKDGNSVNFYSYDLFNGNRVPEMGLNKFMKYLKKTQQKILRAIIYHRPTQAKVHEYNHFETNQQTPEKTTQ